MESDGIEKNNINEGLGDKCDANSLQEGGNHASLMTVLKVEYKSLLIKWTAMIQVLYSWNSMGTQFTCRPIRYAAQNNGRSDGRIYLGFRSAEKWLNDRVTNSAIQDGQWHDISGGGSIAGNSEFAILRFKYIYKLPGLPDMTAESEQLVLFTLNPPMIFNPGVVWDPRPEVNGFGIPGAVVKLYQQDFYEALLGTGEVGSEGRWTAPLTKSLSMTERFTLTASQTVEGTPSRWSVPASFAVLFAPEITAVVVNSDRTLSVSGKGGFKDAKIEIWLEDKSKGIQFTTPVGSDGNWLGRSSIAFDPGEYLITARQIGKVSGQGSGWADSKVAKVIPGPLVIEFPPNPGTSKQVLKINGVWPENAIVQILRDDDTPVSGNFNESTRTFTPSHEWDPGLTPLRGIQIVGGLSSEPSRRVNVSARPPRPIIVEPPRPVAARQVLTIQSVLPNAHVLTMTTEQGVRVAGEFTGEGTTRSFTPAADWTVTTRVRVVQALDNVPSEPSFLITLWVSLFITPPDDPAAADEVLTINFVSPAAYKCEIYRHGGPVIEGRFTGTGTTRTFSPRYGWPLGRTTVFAMQSLNPGSDQSNQVTIVVRPPQLAIGDPPDLVDNRYRPFLIVNESVPYDLTMLTAHSDPVPGYFTNESPRRFVSESLWAGGTHAIMVVHSVDHVDSTPSKVVYLKVIPRTPGIDSPPYRAEPRQPLTITNVESGADILKMFTEDGTPVKGEFTGSDAVRTFIPIVDWTGITNVRVVQTVEGIDSNQSWLVAIHAKPSQPRIEAPLYPAAPRQELTISGVSSASVTLKMYTADNKEVEGSFSPSGTTRTFIPANDWVFGRTPVKVTQSKSGIESDPSDFVTVVVPPPKLLIEQPPKPVAPNQQLNVTGVVSGIVTLRMSTEEGVTVDGKFTDQGFFHCFTPAVDWVGTTKVKAEQTVADVSSEPSDLVTIEVTARPPSPVICQPLPQTSHLASVTVEGTCEAGATVGVQDASGNVLEGEVSYDQMRWSFKSLWLPGQQKIKAMQSLDGLTSDATDVLEFYIKPAKAGIEPPPPPVASKQPLNITDVAPGPVTLKMLTDDVDLVAGDFTGSGAERTFIPDAEWLSGENTVYVIQSVNGVDSDPSDTCTFTVEVADRPDPPRFQQPQRGGGTSRYPTIQVVGLPGALHTVRLVGGDTLCEDTADADGILEFTVVNPLVPGRNELEGKQASNGLDSEFSKSHPFTVHAPPATPVIQVPNANGNASRRPRIRGDGETGGQIVLRHVAEPEPPFACIDGSSTWDWRAEEDWDLKTYEIQAQQIVDGDCSEWTQSHRFHVVESLYGIGDAIPVLGTPVVGTGQSVVLRVQVISADTRMAVEGVQVQWRHNGEQEVLEETKTDFKGWTQYAYTPETVGKREILADITQANAGVVMTETYEVNAVLQDAWAKEAELYLDGQRVDLAASDFVLSRGRVEAYKLELKVNKGSALPGSTVTLKNLWGATERGLTFVPDLETPQVIKQGLSVHWYIFAEKASGGIFGLNLTSSVLPDWQLPGRVEAHITEMVDVAFDSFAQVFGDGPAYPCLGATHTVTVKPRQPGPLIGQNVTLALSDGAAELGVVVSPDTPQALGTEGVSWTMSCVDSHKNGDFAVWLKVQAWNSESAALPMVLGHNKVRITEKYGPKDEAGGWGRYGIRAASTFTEQPAGDVSVTVHFPGGQPTLRKTGQDGWLYVRYDGDIPTLSIDNRYDGSTAKP
ncbi:hypothetical protein NZ35_12850 [Pseudomonas chlororaphis]|uniref:Uncharacterized protein n=1 Tax=Pseudomonas chlororaphis TaxID=587753 RepID=A0A0A6DAP2_9PSED|nr:hypothetical protein NZ35_12850 [Pseudomonas chlororaphis]